MRENKLKQTLNSGKVATGSFLKLTDPAIVEIAGLAGFDFVIIDMEHGPISIETAQNLVRAAEVRNMTPIIRITENHPGLILRALDIGAQGVQIPHISNKSDAQKAVEAIKFHPDGNRGICRFVRAADYSSMDRFKHFEESNHETLTVVQIEGTEGMNNLLEILTVKYLDIIFLGPYDLSQSCGVTGQVNHPKVLEKMHHAVEISQKENKFIGTFVENIEDAQKWIKAGIKYLAFSVDVGIFFEACSNIVNNLKTI